VRYFYHLPIPNMQYHPLSAVQDCLINTFAGTLNTWGLSPPYATRGSTTSWWQESTNIRRIKCKLYCYVLQDRTSCTICSTPYS